MEHVIPENRNKFEHLSKCTWCRRCGRMVANDRFPENVTSKPCQVVKVELR